jgi:hemerythrin-like domain-containing protein
MNDPLPPEIPDFNDPLAVLRADHERILEHCEILEKLVPHIAEKGVDEQARSAINRVVHTFTTSAVHHLQDKQQNLYPILNRQSLKLADIIYRLKREQGELTNLWDTLLVELKTPAALADNKAFATRVEKFCSDYRRHISYETRELLAIAQHILSQRQLQELGDAMARRRGMRR